LRGLILFSLFCLGGITEVEERESENGEPDTSALLEVVNSVFSLCLGGERVVRGESENGESGTSAILEMVNSVFSLLFRRNNRVRGERK
jgi:hypothetical protein